MTDDTRPPTTPAGGTQITPEPPRRPAAGTMKQENGNGPRRTQ